MREIKMEKGQLITQLREKIYDILATHLEIEGGTLTLDDVNTILEDVEFELYLDYSEDDEEEYDE